MKRLISLYLFSVFALSAICQTAFKTIYGSARPDAGSSICVTRSGDFLLGGYTIAHGSQNLFLIRTNSLGDTLWTREYDAGGFESVLNVYEDVDSNIVIIGSWEGFNPTYAIGVYVIKTDMNGNVLWSNLYFGGVYTKASSGMVTSTGDIVVCGMADSATIFDERPFIMKISDAGSLKWLYRYSVTSNPSTYYFDHLAEASNGNYVCGGHTPISGIDISFFVCDTAGLPVVAKSIINSGNTSINDFVVNSSGEIVAVGPCYLNQTFGFFILSIDAFSSVNWMKFYFNGFSDPNATCVHFSQNNEIIVGGLKTSSPAKGLNAKFNSTGNLIYSFTTDPAAYNSGFYDCSKTNDGGSAMIGTAWGAHTPVDSGSIFLVKTNPNGTVNCGEVVLNLFDTSIVPVDTQYVATYLPGGYYYSMPASELNGCSIIQLCAVSVNEIQNPDRISFYPNPTTGLISISGSSDCIIESTTVKDIQGNALLVSKSPQIDLSGFPAGVYIVEVCTQEGRVIRRIVKE